MFLSNCAPPAAPSKDDFFERQNAAHNGDYLATYPLHNPDSCILRLKAEVPVQLQPWGCMGLWYRLPRKSVPTSFRLLDLYEQHYPHDTVRAFGQVKRAEFFVDMGKMDSARLCLDEAYTLYQRLHRPLDVSDVKLLEGRIKVYQNNFAGALKDYFEALDLLNGEDTIFTERHSLLYHDISTAYERSHDLEKERLWLHKAWNANYDHIEQPWLYKARITRGLCMSYLRVNPDSSLYWANVTKDIFEKQLKKPLPARLYYVFGRSYFEKGQCAEALPHLQEAYRKNPERDQVYGYYQYSQALGQCYLCLSKFDSAEVYLTQALSTPDTGNLSALHQQLGEVYAARGQYKKALDAHIESHRLFKIKYTSDQVKAMADMNARYETAQKERRIAELEKQHKIAQQQNLIAALSLLLLLVGALSLYFRQRGRQRILKQEKLLAEAQALLRQQALERTEANLVATQQELNQTAQLLKFKEQLVADLEMRLSEQTAAAFQPPGEAAHFPRMKILTPDDWLRFQEIFEQRFPGFGQRVKAHFPDLTNAEMRLFLLLKLGFDSREIAEVQGISVETIWRNRNRLRKKLGLSEVTDFDRYIQQF